MSKVHLSSLVQRTLGGGTPSRAVADFWRQDIPWASVKDVSAGGRNLQGTEEGISHQGLQASTSNLVELGIPIIAMRMAVGSVATFAQDVAINQDLRALFPAEGVDRNYLYYLLQSVSAKVSSLAVGSTVKGIRLDQLLNIFVPAAPAPAEQRRIADLLSAVEDQIAQSEKILEKRTILKSSVIRDTLSRLAESPLEQLAQLAEVGSGVTLGRRFAGPGTSDYPYLRVANVQDGHIDISDIKTLRLPESVATRAKLELGDVLMNEGGDFDKLGRGAVWRGQIPNCLHQNHVFRVRCNQELLLPDFLALWAASDFGKKFFMLASKQSTNLASINSTQLKKFPVLRPTLDEQRNVLRIVDGINATIELDRQELVKLRLLKQGLSQSLLSGGTEVNL